MAYVSLRTDVVDRDVCFRHFELLAGKKTASTTGRQYQRLDREA
jgi:hypothetical protein